VFHVQPTIEKLDLAFQGWATMKLSKAQRALFFIENQSANAMNSSVFLARLCGQLLIWKSDEPRCCSFGNV